MKRSASQITTKRLWLRQIDETDADAIVQLRADEKVYRYFLNPVKLSIEEHKGWYKDIYCKDEKRIDWIALDDETGDFIGVYGIKKHKYDTIEISYITSPSQMHKGFASEAVEAIIEWGKHHWKCTTIFAEINRNNEASLAFAEKLGFKMLETEQNFLKMVRYDSNS